MDICLGLFQAYLFIYRPEGTLGPDQQLRQPRTQAL
jgi:hypothetical protein